MASVPLFRSTRILTAAAAPTEEEAASRLAVLDGLRGVAILLVLLTHSMITSYHPRVWIGPLTFSIDVFQDGGTLGVDLFYYLSGFVLFLPYAKSVFGLVPRPTLRHFIDRRFIKIVPSFYFAVFAIASIFTLHRDVAANLWPAIASHLTFTFPFSKDTMFALSGAFWSIGVETQFYVIFPFFAAAMMRRPILTYLGIAAIGNAYRTYLHFSGLAGDNYWDFQLPAQIDLFGIGMLSAYGFVKYGELTLDPRIRFRASVSAVVTGIIGFALLSDFAHATRNQLPVESHFWLIDHKFAVSLAIGAFTMSCLFASAWVRAIVANPIFAWFSTISYNLYLWHLSILTQCGITGFPCSGSSTPWTTVDPWNRYYFVSYFAVSVIVAWMITYAFERPLLAMGTRGAFERFVRLPYTRVAHRFTGTRGST